LEEVSQFILELDQKEPLKSRPNSSLAFCFSAYHFENIIQTSKKGFRTALIKPYMDCPVAIGLQYAVLIVLD
jgi:hypothetical protein